MAVNQASKTQAFAAIDGSKVPMKPAKDKPPLPVIAVLPTDESYRLCKKDEIGEKLQVTSTGELSAKPDLCTFSISVSSKKDRVQDVKNSVARRFDYVVQTLHNQRIKDTEMTVNESLQRVNDGSGEMFVMESQVTVCVGDCSKYQPISNILTEKLDRHVIISAPDFSHEPSTLEQARRQASLVAIKNCKLKATEIVQLVACRLGSVVAVREDSCNEWTDDPYSIGDVARDQAQPMTIQQRLRLATVHVTAKVTVVFELRTARKTKSHKS